MVGIWGKLLVFGGMFEKSEIENLNVNNWDTSNVENMERTFNEENRKTRFEYMGYK